jgi:hypothetical protein
VPRRAALLANQGFRGHAALGQNDVAFSQQKSVCRGIVCTRSSIFDWIRASLHAVERTAEFMPLL